MKDTTGTIIVKDTSHFTVEEPTNELRWLLVEDRYNPMLQHKVLQQKWEIQIIENGMGVDCKTEWRDVPEV